MGTSSAIAILASCFTDGQSNRQVRIVKEDGVLGHEQRDDG